MRMSRNPDQERERLRREVHAFHQRHDEDEQTEAATSDECLRTNLRDQISEMWEHLARLRAGAEHAGGG